MSVLGSSEPNPAATSLPAVPWRRGNFTSLLRTPRSAGGRRQCCMPCWTTAEAPKLPVRRNLKGWGSLARIRNSG
ncbi:myelin protein zero, isoform CRA_c [Rattus norvegicus]|uniref:Myelin protein zero, isoform CRA_c n=1 Tax=Rattus norvegicus TaxID=10116 RepID=A6JFU5_RAT|nr:myelin protein zero, isoform CRA_c [Rattus norvegicus]